jgi:hypothetical protein
MARSGMTNLIARVRALTGAGTAEYAAGTVTYWTDDHLQSILDANAGLLIDSPLVWFPQTFNGGSQQWLLAQSPYRDFEEAAGTANDSRYVIRDAAGSIIGTAAYTPDYRMGRVTFGTSQGGTAYYLTAYTYDVHRAAADVWEERLAHFQDWYNFSADNQKFERKDVFDHAMKMLAYHRGRAGGNLVANAGDVRFTLLTRDDLNGCDYGYISY